VLDVSKNTKLVRLLCYNNQLSELDVSNNTALTELWCYNNQLSELDVTKNTALTYLPCYNNQLSGLDVSKNTKLVTLYCHYNQLSADALNRIFADLTDLSGAVAAGKIAIGGNSGTDSCTRSIATAKNWTVRENNL
jgi:Leucine-rich repeat (LRR) protein